MDSTSTIAPPPPPPPVLAPLEAKTPSKSRSFSDPPNINPNTTPSKILAPSPTFLERKVIGISRDDHDAAAIPTTPKTIRRPLSLQMPSPSQFPSSQHRAAPLSPQLDRNNIYMQQSSPATSLPRHSRGLDFSRACTNLHHSTVADSSADSSPIVMQKPLLIPARKGSMGSMLLDSPNMNGGSVPWGTLPPERSAVSSSVGSVNMLASDSESNDSDNEDASMAGDDNEDPIFTTPHVHKLQNPNAATPFVGGAPSTPSAGGCGWGMGSHFSPAQTSLMKTIRRSRLHKNNNNKKSRKSSSSASGSGYSSMNSPRNTSPPPLRSIESATNSGYFNWPTAARSRRESLALGTDGLHLSSGNDSGDEASANNNTNSPSTPAVVRRAVTRRGNLLPKTKGFARIRAALLEEAAPIDTEVRREAETIRQVRERDGSIADLNLTPSNNNSNNNDRLHDPSSPTTQLPAVPEGAQEDLITDHQPKGLGMNFAAHASRNSGGWDYWNRYDASSFRTPPPPPNFARQSSSAMSDINMENTSSSDTPPWPPRPRPRTRSSASDVGSETPAPPHSSSSQTVGGGVMNDDMHLNRFKRRREDDFSDISTIKRRAVSPGMSANNSPVLPSSQLSPKEKDGAGVGWGQPLGKTGSGSGSGSEKERVGSQSGVLEPALSASMSAGSRQGSGGSISLASGSTAVGLSGSGTGGGSAPGSSGGAGGKKWGLQGMVDTNQELMRMSIE